MYRCLLVLDPCLITEKNHIRLHFAFGAIIFAVFWKTIIFSTAAKRGELKELIESHAAEGKHFLSFFFPDLK